MSRLCSIAAALSVGLVSVAAGAPSASAAEYAYAGLLSGAVTQYAIGAGGVLSALNPPQVSAGNNVRAIAITPDGRHLYAGDNVSGAVDAFSIGGDGRLTQIGSPAALGANSSVADLAASPDGRSLYVIDDGGSSSVYQFTIGADGSLTPKSPFAIGAPTWTQFKGLAVRPDGRSLYIAATTLGYGEALRYSIGTDGTVVDDGGKTGLPTNPLWQTAAQSVVVSADGTRLYVSGPNWLSGNSALVSQYSIAPNGSLAVPATPTLNAVANNSLTYPWALALSPAGGALYASETASATDPAAIGQFDVGSGGWLTPALAPTVPFGNATRPEGLAFSPDGASLYVADYGGVAGSIHQFSVTQGGNLVAKTPPSVGGAVITQAIAVTPDQAPVAAFTATPAIAGSPTLFDASRSTAADGTPARYAWSFGDGTTATSAGPLVQHTYATPNNYPVTLTVTDDAGCSTSLVFTGHTASCNGGPSASSQTAITVAGAASPGAASPGAALTTGGGTSTGTKGGVSSGAGTPASPGAPDPTGSVAGAALACTKADLVLIDVIPHGSHVLVSGAARGPLVGRPVAIRFLATGKVVARTVVAKDGTFRASAPLPPAQLRGSTAARYVAIVGGRSSAALRLTRRADLLSATPSGGRVRLLGVVSGAFRPGAKVTIALRVSCSTFRTVATTRLRASGRFGAFVPAPSSTAGGVAVFRAQTTVLSGGRPVPTFTLPRPVSAG